MLRSEIRTMARAFARSSVSGISDNDVNSLIDQAQIFIARDINGIPKRSFVQIEAAFYISTDMRFRMTIAGTGDTLAATDIQISATELSGSTGTVVAAALQTAIRTASGGTGTSVAWTSYYFTITTTGATSQVIEAPSSDVYSNACSILFGAAEQTQTGTAWTGEFPQDCTIEADLPTDFHSMITLSWDSVQLNPGQPSMFHRPQASGTPVNYEIVNDKIRFYTTPSSQEVCAIDYMSVPVGGIASDTTGSSLPARYEMLLVLYAAYLILLTSHEIKEASALFGQYTKEKNKLIINQANQNTRFSDNGPPRPFPPFLVTT